MAVVSQQAISVGTTATQIAAYSRVEGPPAQYLLRNVTASATIYLGPAGVTTATGFPWLTTDPPISIALNEGESLYGVVASGTQTVALLGQAT